MGCTPLRGAGSKLVFGLVLLILSVLILVLTVLVLIVVLIVILIVVLTVVLVLILVVLHFFALLIFDCKKSMRQSRWNYSAFFSS